MCVLNISLRKSWWSWWMTLTVFSWTGNWCEWRDKLFREHWGIFSSLQGAESPASQLVGGAAQASIFWVSLPKCSQKQKESRRWPLVFTSIFCTEWETVRDSLRPGLYLQIWGLPPECSPGNIAEISPMKPCSSWREGVEGGIHSRARVLCLLWASAPSSTGFLAALDSVGGLEGRWGSSCWGGRLYKQNTDGWAWWRVQSCLRKTRLTKQVPALNWHVVDACCLLLWELSFLSRSIFFSLMFFLC